MRNIIEITDFGAPELDVYARLTENQLINRHEPEKGLFIAESPKVVERALDAGYVPVSVLVERKHIEGEARDVIARCKDVPVYTAEFDVLTKLTGFALTRGVLCAMRRPALRTVEEVCKDARRIAILEDVVNPTNVGAIFRSAAALGIDAVLLTPACSNPLYRRALRVSMGTVFQVPWTYFGTSHRTSDFHKDMTNRQAGALLHDHIAESRDERTAESLHDPVSAGSVTHNFPSDLSSARVYLPEDIADCAWPQQGLALLRRLGFKTAAMALSDDSVSIDDPNLMAEEKLAVILGTEGDGLADCTIEGCDYTVKIPMTHGVDSLNVAAASAVAFWQLGIH